MTEMAQQTTAAEDGEVTQLKTALADMQRTLELMQQRLGRGSTAPPTVKAKIAEPKPPPLDAKGRIEQALTRESLTTKHLAKTISESVEKTQGLLKELKSADRVFNVGFEENPIWTWKVGKDVDPQTLEDVIRRLLTERPMSHKELVLATGAPESKVQARLIELRRSENVMDFSGGGHARRYLIVSQEIRDARLTPRRPGAGTVAKDAKKK